MITKINGIQCGFCTPRITMLILMRVSYKQRSVVYDDYVEPLCPPLKHAVEEVFDSNLCRCTGYRSMIDAAQSFSRGGLCGKGSECCMENGKCFEAFGDSPPSKRFVPPNFIDYHPETELIVPPAL